LVTPPRVPLSNRLGGNHAPNISNKMCLRRAERWTSVSPCRVRLAVLRRLPRSHHKARHDIIMLFRKNISRGHSL
jgi:hypothetical protein